MLNLFIKVFSRLRQLLTGKKSNSSQDKEYGEFIEGESKFRYRLVNRQSVYQRNTEDQLNAVIVVPDFDVLEHEELLQKNLKQLGQQLNIDSFSVYQNDDAVAFGSQPNNLSDEEETSFRSSFIGVYPGRRRME